MTETKIVGTAQFIEISRRSIEQGYNRLPTDEFLDSLDPEGTHILTFSMPHEHAAGVEVAPHMRTLWLAKMKDMEKGVDITLDMTLDDFDSLTTLRKNESGEYEVVIGPHGVGRK
jgi:hypothetical protein